jgi:hypothetical protein
MPLRVLVTERWPISEEIDSFLRVWDLIRFLAVNKVEMTRGYFIRLRELVVIANPMSSTQDQIPSNLKPEALS